MNISVGYSEGRFLGRLDIRSVGPLIIQWIGWSVSLLVVLSVGWISGRSFEISLNRSVGKNVGRLLSLLVIRSVSYSAGRLLGQLVGYCTTQSRGRSVIPLVVC